MKYTNLDQKIEKWANNNDKLLKNNKVKLYLEELKKKDINYILRVITACKKYNLNFLLKDTKIQYNLEKRCIFFNHFINRHEIILYISNNAANVFTIVEEADPLTMIVYNTKYYPIDEEEYYKIFDFVNDVYTNFDNYCETLFKKIDDYINSNIIV